jgi:hypothetical protein
VLQGANTIWELLFVFGEVKHLPGNSIDSITPVLLPIPSRRVNFQRVLLEPASVACERFAPPTLDQLLVALLEKVVFEGSARFGATMVAVVVADVTPPRLSLAVSVTVLVPAAL